ncbi:hypothetical protein RO3G_09533 [Rhizopus delemar RA 99-880]|uniref:Uncharacterized protein n=1 Tax=Rhizopus delemar (strain RA 99-880 / ATCC MYA-4621 / FGSC 9543 / NRRL 43880) TaxID=246409 RepID=I1C8P3_RHIO9|nr:hypothetical protein RO3G_09533 [Rhizopus delemar RA 99-880]|eukprot:EIE84823.1 hypothetical protein RO3G_09533 [Rhizopus delemar RA 99-880]
MNNIIDITDRLPGSHLELFNDTHQEQIIEALSVKKLDKITLNTTVFDDIIEKFSNIESSYELMKTIKEIEETKNGNMNIKRVYQQILESWVSHSYLYDMNEDNSEQYYISYDCKIDMRVTIPSKKPVDLSIVEYANKASSSKYYKDKVKTVLCSAIYQRNYQKENNNIKQVPAMLIARLENQILLYYQIDNNWGVVDKVEDADVPQYCPGHQRRCHQGLRQLNKVLQGN